MIDPLLAAGIGMVLLMVFILAGLPVGFGLGLAGLVGILLLEGPAGFFWGLGTIGFRQLWSIGLLAIPFFVFMGNLIDQFGFGADIYDTSYKWFGRLPGGLAVVSTVMSAMFGFMCGSGMAGIATIGTLAIPEMEARKYNRRLALGTLALAGSLAVLIPPSGLMIIYSVQTECSMGRLFFAGILPGLLLTALMSIYIMTRAILNPNIAPKGGFFSISERLKSAVQLIPVIIIFLAVLGGIYMGLWSPVEAGAGGVTAAILLGLFYRRFSWRKLEVSAFRTIKVTSMIGIIFVGAGIISQLFHLGGFHKLVSNALLGLAVPGWGIVIVMLLILMVMGMFLDVMAMILITIPIFLPIILALGYDIIWFGIIMIVSSEMALITPPIGVNLFVLHGIAPKGTSMMDIILGAAPFVVVLWVLLGLLIAFPDIALWLPSTMRRG